MSHDFDYGVPEYESDCNSSPEPSAEMPAEEVNNNDKEIEKLTANLKKLDDLFVLAHKKKASAKILGDISKKTLSTKMLLAEAESKKKKNSVEFKNKKEINKLKSELEELYIERNQLDGLIIAKEDLLKELDPSFAADTPQNQISKVDEVDDDHDRLWEEMRSRRDKYTDLYGIDPSSGSIQSSAVEYAKK